MKMNSLNTNIFFDKNVWLPHYIFVLYTIGMTYPNIPNNITKKKFYDIIHNVPLLIPNEKYGNIFRKLLDEYPVSPYLDSKMSFIRWIHFIETKLNIMMNKPVLSLYDTLNNYYNNYKPKEVIYKEINKYKKYGFFFAIIVILASVSVYVYNK